MIRTEDIKELRAETGAGISEVRKALEEARGDKARALQLLERSLLVRGGKKSERETRAGIVDCYIHSDRRIGVLLELFCETDFVARTSEFQSFAHDIALHVAAMSPLYVRKEDVPVDVLEAERRLITEEVAKMPKSKEILEQIISGKLESNFSQICLLQQPFVKNPDKTVGEILLETSGKFGENMKVGRFVRFAL